MIAASLSCTPALADRLFGARASVESLSAAFKQDTYYMRVMTRDSLGIGELSVHSVWPIFAELLPKGV